MEKAREFKYLKDQYYSTVIRCNFASAYIKALEESNKEMLEYLIEYDNDIEPRTIINILLAIALIVVFIIKC